MLAAISLPPLTDEANRHRPSAAHPGSEHAASNAAPIAATANLAGSAGGRIASPPSSTASAANATPVAAARARKRRSHPRAVVCGTPGDLPGRDGRGEPPDLLICRTPGTDA
jgi:hypothetical protein